MLRSAWRSEIHELTQRKSGTQAQAQRTHRDVLLGVAPLQVVSKELPKIQKQYVQRQQKQRQLKHDYDLLQAATNPA